MNSNSLSEGMVRSWNDEKNFGFIVSGGRRDIYFHARFVIHDPVGHRCINVGDQVRFVESSRDQATSVVVLNRPTVDPQTHREFSQFANWKNDRRRLGFLRRSCGEHDLAFHIDHVITEGANILQPGMWVRHRVRRSDHPSDDPKTFFTAFDVEIFEPGFVPSEIDFEALETPAEVSDLETMFLNAPELPLDERETLPSPVAPPRETVLAPATRNKSLLQIILEKRNSGGQK
jgi:cold shock CspA family protein